MIKEKNKIYKFVIVYLIFTIILTVIAFIYAILLNNGILSTSSPAFTNITFVVGIILFFILGLISGIVAKKNGLIEGLFSSLLILSIALLVNLIIKIEIKPLFFVKIAAYLISSMAGGILGVNWSSKKNSK